MNLPYLSGRKKGIFMFSLLPAFKYGWKQTQTRLWTFVLLTLLISLTDIWGNIRLAAANIEEILLMERPWQFLPEDLILWMGVIVLIVLCINFFIVGTVLAVRRGEKVPAYLGRKIHLFPSYLLLMLLKYLAIGLGLMLFIIPGLLLMLSLYIAEYLLIDKEMPAMEALKASFDKTRGFRTGIFFFELDVFIISYLLSFPQSLWPDTVLTYVIMVLINVIWLPVVWNAALYIYDFILEKPASPSV
jgi:hypothetical protein